MLAGCYTPFGVSYREQKIDELRAAAPATVGKAVAVELIYTGSPDIEGADITVHTNDASLGVVFDVVVFHYDILGPVYSAQVIEQHAFQTTFTPKAVGQYHLSTRGGNATGLVDVKPAAAVELQK